MKSTRSIKKAKRRYTRRQGFQIIGLPYSKGVEEAALLPGVFKTEAEARNAIIALEKGEPDKSGNNDFNSFFKDDEEDDGSCDFNRYEIVEIKAVVRPVTTTSVRLINA